MPRFAMSYLAGLLLAVPVPALGADLQAQLEALNVITDTAAKLCNNIDLQGKSTDFKLSGTAKAEVADLVKYLADLGIEGAAEINQEEYYGLLQRDLGTLVLNNPDIIDKSDCRVSVFDKLRVDLIPRNESLDVNRRILLYFADNKVVHVEEAAYELGILAESFRDRVDALYRQGYLAHQIRINSDGVAIFSSLNSVTCNPPISPGDLCRVTEYGYRLTDSGLDALADPAMQIRISN